MPKVGNILGPAGSVNLATGVWSSRPSAGTIGRLYFATDVGVLYEDNGTAWVPIGHNGTIASLYTATTITNTAAQQAILTASIPQAFIAAGFQVRIRMGGVFTSASGVTLSLQTKLASISGNAVLLTAPSSGPTTKPWEFEDIWSVWSAAGVLHQTQQAKGMSAFASTSVGSPVMGTPLNQGNTISTGNLTVNLTIGTAASGNTAIAYYCYVELLNTLV